MRFKFILAIALILCAFSVLPVSAENYKVDLYINTWTDDTVIELPNNTLIFDFRAYSYYLGQVNCQPYNIYMESSNGGIIQCEKYDPSIEGAVAPFVRYGLSQVPDLGIGEHLVQFDGTFNAGGGDSPAHLKVKYRITQSLSDYDIVVEKNENIINLGNITDLNQSLSIGSNQNGSIILYNSYTGINCTILNLESDYTDIRLDENFNTARINLLGDIDYNGNLDSFNTHALIYYNYQKPILPANNIQAFIQTYDYQNGNMLSGVNMSVYEVTENGDNLQIGNKIYSSINAESQTILTVKNNTEYFIENELTGYFAVKNEHIASLNNRYGYLWNPSLINPLRLYYNRLDPSAQYNANFIVQDVNNNGIAGVTVTMDNSITKISNSIGGLTFNNVSAGPHTFTFVKNGYQSAQRTIDIQLQYAAFTQTLFKDDQIIQPTVSPTAYPTTYPTVSPSDQPTLSPIDKPSNIMESVSFGFAKIFGVKTVENANYIFALMLILFPAVVAGGITHQALGFIAGGMIGFVFALAVGLVPIWVFFAMCLLAVIYFVLKGGNEGF